PPASRRHHARGRVEPTAQPAARPRPDRPPAPAPAPEEPPRPDPRGPPAPAVPPASHVRRSPLTGEDYPPPAVGNLPQSRAREPARASRAARPARTAHRQPPGPTLPQRRAGPTTAGSIRTAILSHRDRPEGPIHIFCNTPTSDSNRTTTSYLSGRAPGRRPRTRSQPPLPHQPPRPAHLPRRKE